MCGVVELMRSKPILKVQNPRGANPTLSWPVFVSGRDACSSNPSIHLSIFTLRNLYKRSKSARCARVAGVYRQSCACPHRAARSK
ncbi:hypothetical protein EVAR_30554_1 [Eumeta japonica]|uniref:Uncharacterized protein n=1 Tax=Eumeta variegata TaxID=151549 RepID=A0A4C1VRQ9_EUMVA|nr:hypothetical protein EVAR_30554_1 [Eumeta japonica]